MTKVPRKEPVGVPQRLHRHDHVGLHVVRINVLRVQPGQFFHVFDGRPASFSRPIGKLFKTGAIQQIFPERQVARQHGVQDHPRAPHVRLGAVVPLVAVLEHFGRDVVG